MFTAKYLLQKLKIALIVPAYFMIYMPWFMYIERMNSATSRFHIIHMAIDDYIPFCEYFVIPYFIWFAYMVVGVLYCLFTDEKVFKRTCAFLFIGMTIFLIVSTIYPNGHRLRPQIFEQTNIFTQLTAYLYSIDTPTNLFPSIHVFNSIGVHIALCHNQALAKIKWAKIGSFVICSSIVLSTVFLKQHSMFDVLTAFAMAFLLYPLAYKTDYSPAHQRKKIPQEQKL